MDLWRLLIGVLIAGAAWALLPALWAIIVTVIVLLVVLSGT